MKKCKECQKEFEPKTQKGLFCSFACRQKDYRKSVAAKLKEFTLLQENEKRNNALMNAARGRDENGVNNDENRTKLKFTKKQHKKTKDNIIKSAIDYKPTDKDSYDGKPKSAIEKILNNETKGKPTNLSELKAMCPFKEFGEQRSVWISDNRQKYNI